MEISEKHYNETVGDQGLRYLQLDCVSQRPGHSASRHPGSFHILTEQSGHEDVGSRPHPQPVGQPRHHQTGQGQHGEDREGEAEPHHHHGQGGHQEKHGGDVLAVIAGLQQWRQQVANCDGRLRYISYLSSSPCHEYNLGYNGGYLQCDANISEDESNVVTTQLNSTQNFYEVGNRDEKAWE